MVTRVGIIGTGRMARDFTAGMASLDSAVVHAVGSRSRESAERFANAFPVPRAYDSIEALLTDPDIDLVYVATPHSEHARMALMSLDYGKPVLCEKPFTLNAGEARQVIERGHDRRLFVAEAMWSRHLPAYVKLRELLASGTIGNVQFAIAGGAFMPGYDPAHYLFNLSLGGGVLLDAGVYLVSLASMVFGEPRMVKAVGAIGEHGVDEQDAVILEYSNGDMAVLYVSLRARQAPGFTLYGGLGSIRVHSPIFAPTRLTLSIYGDDDVEFDLPFEGNGYHYQVADAAECIAAGRTESAVMPLNESLIIMRTLDEIRRQIGLKFPMES